MYLTAPDNFLYVCFMLVSGNKCTPYVVSGTYLASHLDKRVSSNAMINCVNSSVLCRHPSNDIQFPRQIKFANRNNPKPEYGGAH